ncbi:MAG: AI-2E family transporter [Aristaeellaceae bacterium]
MRLSWKSCMRAGLTIIVVYLVLRYWEPLTAALWGMVGAAGPLLLGCVVAYVVNILMSFYERNILPYSKKPIIDQLRRPGCMLLAYVTVLLAVFFMVRMILPELINALIMIIEQLPSALAATYAWIEQKLAEAGYLDEIRRFFPATSVDWQSTVTKAVNLVINSVGGVLGATVSMVSTTVGQVITLFLGLVFSAYLLLSKEKLKGQFQRLLRSYLGEKTTRRMLDFIRTLDSSFHSYIVGQCTEALILGSLCILGMLLFRFPYAVMIGTLVGFTALIPIAGAYIGAVVGAFMIFTVSPVKALLFVIFLTVLQQLEGNLIFPRVVGQSIGLPGMWVLAAVTVGGGVAGIPGMLFGVPLTAAFYRLIREDINQRTDMLLPLRSIPAMRDEPETPPDPSPKDKA